MKSDDDVPPEEIPDRIAAGVPEDHDEDDHRGPSWRAFWVMLVGMCLAVALAGWIGQQASNKAESSQDRAQAATSTATAAAKQADDLASQIQAACAIRGSVRDALIKLGACQQASSVKAEPAGKTTKPPRRVSAVAIIDDALVVTYSDGTTRNLGRVVGKAGEIGATGQPGKPGKDATGKPGKDATGKPGQDGVGIVSALPNGDGHLIVSYSDGRTVDAGQVVGRPGKDGKDGKNGADGVSVTGVSVSDSYHLLVTLSNGTVQDVGQLPPGPPGRDGADGKDGKDGAAGKDGRGIDRSFCGENGRWTNTYSDGETGDGGVCRETSTATTTTTVTAPPTSPDPTSTAPGQAKK